MTTRQASLVAVLALAALASRALAADDAASWEEPTLEEALGRAKLVVRARCLGAVADDSGGGRVMIDHAIVGKAPGDSLAVQGLEGPASLDAVLPPWKVRDEAILVLEEAPTSLPGKPVYRVPTPSFGRFPVEKGRVRACVRDSFVRVDMDADEYERFLANAAAVVGGGKADVAWLSSARVALEKLDPTAKESFAAAHVALEALCYGAHPTDAELALRYFGSPEAQLRVSAARLLVRAGGERAASGLLRLAVGDSEPMVRSVATLALSHVKPLPEGAAKQLAAAAREASAAPVALADPRDPRRGELASNLGAIFETLRALEATDDATSAAIELLAKNDESVLAEACLYLTRAHPITRLREIAGKMREADDPNKDANRFIAELLRKTTGAPIGVERDRWLYWLDQNKDIYPEGAK